MNKEFGFCKGCDQIVEPLTSSNGVDFCPECRTVEEIDWDYEEQEIQTNLTFNSKT